MREPVPGAGERGRRGRGCAASFLRIRIWDLCFDLALEVIRLAGGVPRPEGSGLVAEIRSAAILIPSYLGETPGNPGKRKFLGDLYQALSSLSRLEIQILICAELGYLKREEFLGVEMKILEIRKLAGDFLRNSGGAGRSKVPAPGDPAVR